MLRSLVGSEMCIRDRSTIFHAVLLCLLLAGCTVNGTTSTAQIASGYDLSCLLYTSDAADDLLCVDLGGRRIIKKKKNK